MWRCYLHLRWMFFPFLSPLAIFMVHLIFWHNWCFFPFYWRHAVKKEKMYSVSKKNDWQNFWLPKSKCAKTQLLARFCWNFWILSMSETSRIICWSWKTFFGSSLTLYRWVCMFTFLLPLVWLVWYLEPHWPSSYPSPSLLKHSASSVLQHYACRYSE